MSQQIIFSHVWMEQEPELGEVNVPCSRIKHGAASGDRTS